MVEKWEVAMDTTPKNLGGPNANACETICYHFAVCGHAPARQANEAIAVERMGALGLA